MARRGGVAILLLSVLLMTGCSTHRPEPRRSHDWRANAPSDGQPAISPPPQASPPAEVHPAPAPPAQPSSPPVSWPEDAPRGAAGEIVRAGRDLVDHTPARLKGTGNLLSCSSCHLSGGTRDGHLSWLGAAATYPQYAPREGRLLSLADRINACVARGLNGPALADGSREMEAILAYLRFLGGYPAQPASPFAAPDRKADLLAGDAGYRRACSGCHGANGEGSAARQAPPLWDRGSYTTGCGLHRVRTAAAFIQERMPPVLEPGRDSLTAGEAFDIAAFVNSFARPETPNLEKDYPALSEKPADCPYPPYPDRFPPEQHKYGSFPPIEAEAAAAVEADWRRFHWDLADQRAAEAARVAAGHR